MRSPRILLAAVAVASALTVAMPAGAGPLDDCAQRVIRDWYSGGRVDGVYPLACYRAAIRALPEDVLQYSNADGDIARALADAQRRRVEGSNAKAPARAPEQVAAPPAATEPPETSRAARAPKPESRPRASTRTSDRPARLAGPARVDTASAGVPYPVLALAALAALLLLSAAAASLRARRR